MRRNKFVGLTQAVAEIMMGVGAWCVLRENEMYSTGIVGWTIRIPAFEACCLEGISLFFEGENGQK